ncbi:Tetratricopeptide repeat protein 25 [Folsomia candida]|uniref:Outer dynein arm-docking complex subunit 4 n=1 Tax=Folsomia candida TaxID=158441 RepID=A0A226DZ70_FOLCA|nr:Tetratricopeptide repeat protein 25 [Folsomia candida]
MEIDERLKKYPHCPLSISTFTTFSDEGNMHFRAGHFRKALYCFDRALELQPDNKGARVSRSQCHLKLGDAVAALADAEASFVEGEKSNIMGLYQYGEALFNLGQFEQALMAYHRGYRSRKDKEEFRVGVNKAKDAIVTAIGDQQATQIEDLDTVLPQIDEINAANRGPEHCCVLSSLNEMKQSQQKSRKANALTFARSRWVDREILGVLQQDKDYLTKFLKRPDIHGDAQSSSEGLRGKANEALNYLEIRQKFWRQQNPMYARKIGLTFNNDMVRQYEAHDCQLECERALRQIKEISQRLLPRKPEFLTEILHFKGLALMKLKSYDNAATAFQEEFKVAADNKMPETKSRALDYLGRSYALKGSFAEGAEIWDSRLAISKTPIERAYLFHEIGRCYYETNKFDLAKIYGNQCLDEASKINDNIWKMNAEILLAQCEVKSKTFDKANQHFEKAEEYALNCNNKANVGMLREAEQCIKIYMERADAGTTHSHEDDEKDASDDDKDLVE